MHIGSSEGGLGPRKRADVVEAKCPCYLILPQRQLMLMHLSQTQMMWNDNIQWRHTHQAAYRNWPVDSVNFVGGLTYECT